MSCSALNVDLRHKDPPKLLSLRDGGFLSACVLKGTWELEVGGAGGAGARSIFLNPRGTFTTGLPSHREGVSLGASAATRRRAWEIPAGGASLLPRVKNPGKQSAVRRVPQITRSNYSSQF